MSRNQDAGRSFQTPFTELKKMYYRKKHKLGQRDLGLGTFFSEVAKIGVTGKVTQNLSTLTNFKKHELQD